MADNATTWPKMIRAVYSSFDTGRHQGDHVARRVMDRVVSWLTAGLELSPKLQAALLDNIRMRTHYQVENPVFPIKLTRNQIAYARDTNPEWFGLGMAGEEEGAENPLNSADLSAVPEAGSPVFQQVFSSLSAGIQQSFSSFSALFPQEALALAQHLVSTAAENCGSGTTSSYRPNPKVMEWEEKGSNHELNMILAVGREVASPPLGHEALPGSTGDDQAMTGQDPDLSHEPQADRQDNLVRSGEGVPPAPAPTSGPAPCLTVWVKTDGRGKTHATGYLDRDGSKYAVRLTDFDHALGRIGTDDRQWHDRMERRFGGDMRSAERSAKGVAARATTSGLFGERDTWARQNPLFADQMVMVEWDQAQPVAALLIQGEDQFLIDLKQETNNRFKGVAA